MGNSITEKPKDGQVVIVYCPDYCSEEYQVATYYLGKYNREPNGDMTEFVKEWIPIEKVEDLF
jgi:hypothetical protein